MICMKSLLLLIFLFIYLVQLSCDEVDKNSSSAVVFMYHRFGESKYPSTNIKIEQFAYQLDYLQKNNYNVWPLSKIVRYFKEGKKIPQKTVAISIDDAYITAYTNAYPMLKAKKYPFTVFVNTNPTDHKSKRYMSWDNMREMALHGAEFANHTLKHDFLLPREFESEDAWRDRVVHQITAAQKRLHEELGESTNENPRLFSYTFGEYTNKVANLVKSLGYVGFTQLSGVISSSSDFRALPRFAMAESFANSDGFILKLNTLAMPIESVSISKHIIEENNPPKLGLKLKRELEGLRCYISSGEPINLEWISKNEVEIQSNKPLKAPRDRYTCTAPAENGKWYWYSYLWIVKDSKRE